MKCVEVYKELYHQEPFDVAFCPYRISPLGAHIDHQYGKINGLAIDKGIHMAYHPKQNGVVELQSLNFPKRAQFFVSAVPDEKQGDWADHLRGATKMLGEKYRLKVGLSGIIEGSLPIGGLSSSASVIICFLSALCKVNGIHLEPMEMILTAKAAENQYVGVSCGKLDQSCEVLSKKNHLLYLDTKDDSYELIPTSEKMKPYTEFHHLPFTNGHPNADKEIRKPANFDEMLRIAGILSKGMPEVRVDLYNVNGKILFGEMTFFHWSGLMPFEPEEWDYKFGSWIELPEVR